MAVVPAGKNDFIGAALLLSCTDFDTTSPPSPAKPRIQFVLERSGKG